MAMACCPNCGETPKFLDSADPEFPVLLAHRSSTCPGRFQADVYADTEAQARSLWKDHVGRVSQHRSF
jgi:hypothetical protein